MRVLGLILWLAIAVTAAVVLHGKARAESRAQKHWGGSDFPFSCASVLEWRGAIHRMSPARRAELARKFKITPKQRRQAYACLRGR